MKRAVGFALAKKAKLPSGARIKKGELISKLRQVLPSPTDSKRKLHVCTILIDDPHSPR